jgi:hypothetical protein
MCTSPAPIFFRRKLHIVTENKQSRSIREQCYEIFSPKMEKIAVLTQSTSSLCQKMVKVVKKNANLFIA